MKKLMVIISIIFLFVNLPIGSANYIPSVDADLSNPENFDDDAPDWATGSFIGVIGFTNIMGRPGPYHGYIAGYYEKEDFKGKFVGILLNRNDSESVGSLGGFIANPFMIGVMNRESTEKYHPIVGITLQNETHVYIRIMGLFGPTFYLACKYSTL